MINAKIIADSKSEFGRLTTMQVTFPRYILAELNTHRMFSRNSASSRAIPFKKMVESVNTHPFIPIAWQKDHSGMQGTEYIEDDDLIQQCEWDWLQARDFAVQQAESLNRSLGVTKQICNRLLEPFMWHTVLLSATEFSNFWELRCPQYHSPVDTHFRHKSKKDLIAAHSNPENLEIFSNFTGFDWLKINEGQADIHMMELAEAMYDAYNESNPKLLQPSEWHIPFGDNINGDILNIQRNKHSLEELKIRIAVARCARVSYTVFGEEEKPFNYENDLKLHDKLLSSGHMSPFEHIGRAMTKDEYNSRLHIANGGQHGWSGNFKGFIQYRQLI
jgi:thymidylate synthase ThyX